MLGPDELRLSDCLGVRPGLGLRDHLMSQGGGGRADRDPFFRGGTDGIQQPNGLAAALPASVNPPISALMNTNRTAPRAGGGLRAYMEITFSEVCFLTVPSMLPVPE